MAKHLKVAALTLAAAVVMTVAVLAFAERVDALPPPGSLDVAQMQAAAGPGYSDSFTVSCTSAAAVKIQASGNQQSYVCQNTSTTKVAVGDSGISDPGTTFDAPIYCATNCPGQEWGGNLRFEYCRGDTDTTIVCRALVTTQ